MKLPEPGVSRRRRRWPKRLLLATLTLLLTAGAASLAFKRQFVVSRAMAPGLLTGDVFAMSRVSYGLSRHSFSAFARFSSTRLWPAAPRRGDVAVVKLPRDGQTDFVLRVIGLPGEHVQLRGRRIHINDTVVEREAAAPVVIAASCSTNRPMPRRFPAGRAI